ncbi:hypothetical protein TREES_T100020679 [Tupaia chinensis]|uniref:Uncharacterized protein n=1 Tax=Tupaia chinensis TaxID=246437 RepID=L9KM24_TUPCH|nr:hypothetical protein TREES_T100020679 [Tupaia chinensis]
MHPNSAGCKLSCRSRWSGRLDSDGMLAGPVASGNHTYSCPVASATVCLPAQAALLFHLLRSRARVTQWTNPSHVPRVLSLLALGGLSHHPSTLRGSEKDLLISLTEMRGIYVSTQPRVHTASWQSIVTPEELRRGECSAAYVDMRNVVCPCWSVFGKEGMDTTVAAMQPDQSLV